MKSLPISATLFFLAFIFCLTKINAETKFVWATNGLNLRTAPNTSSEVIGKLSFGDSLTILETTELKYTNLLINKTDQEKHPIFLTSYWVKIRFNGKEGFVINGYLLDFPCPKKNEQIGDYLRRMSKEFGSAKLDTELSLRFGNVRFQYSQLKLPNGKRIGFNQEKFESKKNDKTESERDYGNEEFRYFQGFTMQEILIFLNPFYGTEIKKQFEFKVRRNWAEMIWLTDGGMQEIELTKFNNKVIVFYYKVSC